MSKAKQKIMEKMIDGLVGDFDAEKLIDAMFEKPLIVYAEIAVFKTDTGKFCITFNKLPEPINVDKEVMLPDKGKLIVIPCPAEQKTDEAIK
jgi:hypothetical protein